MLLEFHKVLLVKGASSCLHHIRNQQETTGPHGQARLLGHQAMRYHVKRTFRLKERLWIVKDGTCQKGPVFGL